MRMLVQRPRMKEAFSRGEELIRLYQVSNDWQ